MIGRPLLVLGFCGKIEIYSVTSSTITATAVESGNIYTAIADANGYALIKVKEKGEYTIASSGTTRNAYVTVLDSNIITAVYKWGKYTIGSEYVPYTVRTNGTIRGLYSYSSANLYRAWSTYIDQANARFVLSGAWSETGAYAWHKAMCDNPGLQMCGTLSSDQYTIYMPFNYTESGGRMAYNVYGPYRGWCNSGASTSGSSYNDYRVSNPATIQGLTTQPARGDYIEDVTRTTLTALPDNGVSGNNWYTAI